MEILQRPLVGKAESGYQHARITTLRKHRGMRAGQRSDGGAEQGKQGRGLGVRTLLRSSFPNLWRLLCPEWQRSLTGPWEMAHGAAHLSQGNSLSVDEDDRRCGEMELKVVGEVPRPAITLKREEQSDSFPLLPRHPSGSQLPRAGERLPWAGQGQGEGGRNFHGKRKEF